MKHKIEKVFKEKLQPFKDSNFLIAVSGGVDSMVLVSLFKTHNLKFSVAHCNFKLRADESDADERFVLEYAKNNKNSSQSRQSQNPYEEKTKTAPDPFARPVKSSSTEEILSSEVEEDGK